MRHKIEMSGNIGFLNKNIIQENPDDIFYLSFLRSHPKIQNKYKQESDSFNNLLEESRKLQLKLLMELEEFIMINYDFKRTNRVSMLDYKWSNILNKKLKNRLWLFLDYLDESEPINPEKKEQINNYLFSEIDKDKDLNSISKLYKDNKNKKFDCITLEFHKNSYNNKVLNIFSLLTKKGMSIVSIPAKDYSDVKESLDKTDFYINALCSQRDCDFDEDDWGSQLINEKFSRPIYSRYIVLLISRNTYGNVFIGSEFGASDFGFNYDEYLGLSLDPEEDWSKQISSIVWDHIPGMGDNCVIEDFYDLENLYSQIKYHELKGDYLSYKEHSLSNTASLKTSDIYQAFLFLSNIKNTTKISLKNKAASFEPHRLFLLNFIKKAFSENQKSPKKTYELEEQYTKDVENLLSFKAPSYFHKIDKLLILEWRVDGANNCQFCGIFHLKDWTVSEEKYWDPNYYIECIEIDTKVVKVDYLLMFYKSQMGKVLIDLAIDELNANGDSRRPELWKYLSFLVPSQKLQSKTIEAIKSIENLTKTLKQSQQSIVTSPENIEDIIKDLKSWQASLGLLNNSSRIEHLISEGESDILEFKQTFSLDIKNKTKKEIYMETSCLKTICGFLNSKGGILLIGVSDDGKIIGLSEEIELFHKKNQDNLLKHFKNKISHRIQGFDDFISYKAISIEKKIIIEVTTKAIKYGIGCYLDGKDFYIRRNPGTDKLEGQELVIYNKGHFEESKS